MTTLPPARALLPVLARMALGLLIASAGVLLALPGTRLEPALGLQETTTPLDVPLDGPQPLDLAQSATVRLTGDRTRIEVRALPGRSPDLLSGEARHRARNAVEIRSERQGSAVTYAAALNVQSSERGVALDLPGGQVPRLRAALSDSVPLSLSTLNTSGDQTLNLPTLRLRALTARSDSGRLDLTLPGRPGGPYAVVTRSGDIRVEATQGASPEAVRVNSQSGNLDLDLRGSVVDALNVGSQSGSVRLILPDVVGRGSVTTLGGAVVVTASAATRGNLDIRTQSGNVVLKLPPGLRVRVRFTDRDTLTLPPGTPPATAPELDVFVDTSSGEFSVASP